LNLLKHEERTFEEFIRIFAINFGIWINYWTFRVLVVPKIKEEFLMKFALYFLGGIMIMRGQLGIAGLLVFMQYHALFAANMQSVSETDADLVSGTPQSDRLLEEMEYQPQREEALAAESCGIEFENVSFAYNSENVISNIISFTINEGEKVAIAGKSGAGKTTMLKLIAGMLRPSTGFMRFSGKIGFVMQENTLFNDTIAGNLLYADANATQTQMREACKRAHILDFIESLPDKFETVVGERGIKLSGGQKQRLVLARQFLRNADVYIFDEATSALDQNSEDIVQKAIADMGADKTVIIVSHRESSIAVCDRVIEI